MIWNSEQRQQPAQPTNQHQRQSGAAGEKLELLKLRESDDVVARAVALGFLLMLRKLEELTAGLEVDS